MHIIVKKYEHYNRAIGKYITSKAHYEDEVKRGGFISYEECKERAERAKKEGKKEYKLSAKAKAIIDTVKNSADKKGNVKLGDRTIKAMKEIGAIKKTDIFKLPSAYSKIKI